MLLKSEQGPKTGGSQKRLWPYSYFEKQTHYMSLYDPNYQIQYMSFITPRFQFDFMSCTSAGHFEFVSV